MDKAARLAMYRCAVVGALIGRGGQYDGEYVDSVAMAMLRNEAFDVSGECDAGPCLEPKESGSRWCKGHGGRS